MINDVAHAVVGALFFVVFIIAIFGIVWGAPTYFFLKMAGLV